MGSRIDARGVRVMLVAGLMACGSKGTEPINVNITPDGGTISLAGGIVTLTVPAGAVSAPTLVTATSSNGVADSRLLIAYDLGPNGQTFLQPITLKIRLGAIPLPPGMVASTGGIYKVVSGQWTKLATSAFSAADTSVSVSISSFSTYGVLVGNVGPAGAVLSLGAGAVQLTVPAGALTDPQFIAATASASAPAFNRRVSGTAFDLTPPLNFGSAASLRINYSQAGIPSFVPESTLGIWVLNGLTWSRVAGGTKDTLNNTATAQTSVSGTFTVAGDSIGAPVSTGTNEPAGYTLISDRHFDAKTDNNWLDRGDAAFSIQTDASSPFPTPLPGLAHSVGVATYPAGFIGGAGPINTRRPVDTFNFNVRSSNSGTS